MSQLQSIFGADIYIPADSMDGQLAAIEAQAIADTAAKAAEIFNSFSPAFAQGYALEANCKINGLTKAVATKSTVDVTIEGTTGTVINNGVVGDVNNNKWDLPATVTIPASGTITITATAQEE